MKLKITAAVIAALMLCSCSTENNEPVGEIQSPPVSGEVTAQSVPPIPEEQPVPFSEYTFELRGASENYMLIVRQGEYDDEISVTVENNRYESREFVITAPSGYDFIFPYDQKYASEIVNVIKNDIDSEYIPDIMQLSFSISQEELDNNPDNTAYNVSRMYTVDAGGELREIRLVSYSYDEDGERVAEVRDYLDKTQFYHTEPAKFIYEISVDDSGIYDEDGDLRPVEDRVRIKTMTFVPEVPEFVLGYEDISEENPLYFGYAYWATANLAAQNFTMSAFNISDFDNFIEIDGNNGMSEYYFRIDDPRFSSTEDLIRYLETIFSESSAQRIFTESPQKYRDIDGELYGIAGDGGYDYSLGTLTFSGMEISENRMLFRSRQEKYDENGVFTGYTDGGNFVITRQEDGSWRVIQYRYPYSFN